MEGEQKKEKETKALILFALVFLIVFLFYSISPRPEVLQSLFYSVKLCPEIPTGQFCKYGSWQCLKKERGHICKISPVWASSSALSNTAPSPPRPFSLSVSGALTVVGVKSNGSLCRGRGLFYHKSRGEGIVRGNRRSVDPPATDYPRSQRVQS